jgi:hypothetical protein
MAVPNGSRRPSESAFKQQKLRAWQPILTPKWVISCFTIVGTIFIPIGVAIMMASKDVGYFCAQFEHVLVTLARITHFMFQVLEQVISYGGTCKADPYRSGQVCVIPFTLSSSDGWNSRDVFVYYQLDNFYQNHRRYDTILQLPCICFSLVIFRESFVFSSAFGADMCRAGPRNNLLVTI